MSNEHLQKELRTTSYSDTNLTAENSTGVQALLLGAYLDDKKRWEENLRNTSETMADKLKEMSEVRVAVFRQSKIKSFIFKIFKRKTKQEKRLIQIMNEVEELKNQFINITSSPPSPNTYELAMMGNIFRVR